MFKRILSAALILTLMLSVFCAVEVHADQSVVLHSGDWAYGVKDDGTAIVYQYKGTETDLTVPEEINGHRVSELSRPFDRVAETLVSVTLPDGLERIDTGAFYGCAKLQSVTIPQSVTVIDTQAFAGCSSLSGITLPEGVTEIWPYAFSGCTSLDAITLPQGLTFLGGRAFDGCTSLKSIVLPDGLTKIESFTFNNCGSLEEVTLGKQITAIGTRAFFGCLSLTQIFIPSSVTEIESYSLGYYEDDHRYTTYDLIIKTPAGSAAEEYAENNRLQVVTAGEDIPIDTTEPEGGIFVRLSDDDIFEVSKGEKFILVFYTAGLNPTGWIWGNLQLDKKVFKAIDAELYVPEGQEESLMKGDLTVFSDLVDFDLEVSDTDSGSYESFRQEYPLVKGAEVDAYVQPIFQVTMKAIGGPGTYDIRSEVLAARDIGGKLLADCDIGYRSKYFSCGLARVTDELSFPYPQSVKESLRGDADEDGAVTILDATRIQRRLADLIDDSGLDMQAADADLDGSVTILDATRIQRVLADLCDMDGNTPDDPVIPVEPEKPDYPQITKVESSNAGVVIKWDAFDGAEAYRVFIKSGSSWKKLGDTEATTFTHTDAPYNTECVYTVRCISKTGEFTSDFDKDGYANTRLRTPTLKSAKLLDGYIGVSWDKVEGASAYRIYIKGGKYTSWTWAYDSDINYIDVNAAHAQLESGTKYTFTVRCVDQLSGDRLMSGHDTAGVSVVYYDTPFIYGIVNADDGIELYWTEVSGVAKYRVFEWNGSGWKKLADISGTSLLITGLTRGEYYRFTVRGLDSSGNFITPYNSYGRMIERDPSRPGSDYGVNAAVRNIEDAAAELGFCADTTVSVSSEEMYFIDLDYTGYYAYTSRMEELVTQKSISEMKDFVNMLRRNGEQPSYYCFSIEAEPDEYDEIQFYLVVARRIDV